MAGIDPMFNLVNTILDEKEIVILLGSEASMEGRQGEKSFPGFDELIDNILKDWGFDPTQKKKRIDNFLTVIKKWEKEKILPARLRKYLGGEPGQAHYSLAALSIALVSESNAMLYLTTNYDNLMKKAFTDLEKNPVNKFDTVDISLRPHIIGSEFQGMVNNIEDFIRKGEPVILKLFGDLNSQSPIFRQEDMKFEPGVEEKLLEWMRKPMIFIGYSFSDKIMQQLFIAARGNSPVFLVTPSGKKIPTYIKERERVHHIKKRFYEFMLDLYKILKERNPPIIEKAEKILESFGSLPEPPLKKITIDETKPSYANGVFSKIKPIKILILAANPKTTTRLRLDEEIREIEKCLHHSKQKEHFEIKSILAVRLTDLREVLLDYEPNIVHFTGHGQKNGLLLEDELGMAMLIDSKTLSELFEQCSAWVRCVILNAGDSASLANAINRHINFVIGMRREIADKAAIEFVVGFYSALGAGKSVEEAFKFGRVAILQNFPDLPEHLIPVLKKRKDLEKQDSFEIWGQREKSIGKIDNNTMEQSSKKILILSANPRSTVRLRVDEEIREIGKCLQKAKYKEHFEIKSILAVRLTDLREVLLDYEPNIVHFTGHGNKEGLFVEDELGMAVRLSTKALSGLFELFSTQLECVILNSCYSAHQANAISKHINYVIGMRKEIVDDASIEFVVGFYDALGAGRSVEEAFEFGRNAILQNFPDLSEHLIPVLKKKKGLEKQNSGIVTLINKGNKILFPDFNSIQNLVKQCSKASLLRAEERIPKIEVHGKIRKLAPIPRDDTSPDFDRFIQSDRPLLVIIGDAGSGKSTLLYRLAKNEYNKKFTTLFYDVHHLQSSGSLTSRLTQDFHINPRQLEPIFKHFNKILSNENKKLLIMVDGLNESIKIEPSALKIEIEDLGAKLPQSIKIAYSCRTIYWNSYIKINAPMPPALYYGSKEFMLYLYSEKEAKMAFEAYKDLFKIQVNFENLRREFIEKFRDPLMMRMLAESYRGQQLPSFAPAVKIFTNYEHFLKKKFYGTVLMDFLEELILQKLSEVGKNPNVTDHFDKKSIRENAKLSALIVQQININKKNPLILLEDDGILISLDKEKNLYRFTYDRFFEYLLGKEIGNQFKIDSQNDFVTTLNEKIPDFHRVHFSFIKGLKSEIIRKNIEDSDGIWSFYNANTLKLLLNSSDAAVVNFTKEVLRELTFESERDILMTLRGISDDALSWKFLALDVAGDSPKIKPILIDGLFSGEKHFIRRCVQIMKILNEDRVTRENLEDILFSVIKSAKEFKKEHAVGLIYYTALIFSLEDQLQNDPFEKIKEFWKAILDSIQNEPEKANSIIGREFVRLIINESPFILNSKFNMEGITYLWEEKMMTQEVKEAALKMVPFLVEPAEPINKESKEIIRFFGSEIMNWEGRNEPEKNQNFTYGIEYRIALWILIQRSQKNFEEVQRILIEFVDSGYWLNFIFALNTMGHILFLVHHSNREIVEAGFALMKQWTEKFERESERFYDTLQAANPFNSSFNPLEQTARIDATFFAPKNGPLSFLEERLTSSNERKIRLALLCTRNLWEDNPRKILGSLELVVNSQHPIIKDWLEKILKEIYTVYPRLAEDFFWKNNFHPRRIQSIKCRNDNLDTNRFYYEPFSLYKALFLSNRERIIIFVEWYKKLLKSKDIDRYFHDLINFLFAQIDPFAQTIDISTDESLEKEVRSLIEKQKYPEARRILMKILENAPDRKQIFEKEFGFLYDFNSSAEKDEIYRDENIEIVNYRRKLWTILSERWRSDKLSRFCSRKMSHLFT